MIWLTPQLPLILTSVSIKKTSALLNSLSANCNLERSSNKSDCRKCFDHPLIDISN